MRLLITVEAQNCTENGLAKILSDIIDRLSFVTDRNLNLENKNNYGTEFELIAIIPSCVDDDFWNALGWKERKQIWRKKKEADIRLRMNYNRFAKENIVNQRLMFIDILVKSIEAVCKRSKGDFRGEELIKDVLMALDVTREQLQQFN